MKAEVNGYEIKLDKEAIKALRFVLGFTTDLRVKLNLKSNQKSAVWDFLDQRRIYLFGSEYGVHPDPASDEWHLYEKALMNVVKQIEEG